MKLSIFACVACAMMATSCVINSNIAWRGQTDSYKYNFEATTEGRIENAPKATKGDSRIDAQKEYSDSFKTNVDAANEKQTSAPTAEQFPAQSNLPSQTEAETPVTK